MKSILSACVRLEHAAAAAVGPALFLVTVRYNCCVVRPGAPSVCVRTRVCVSDCIMVPAFVDAVNEWVCLRHCALFPCGYGDAPDTGHHGNRKWAGHLAHQ